MTETGPRTDLSTLRHQIVEDLVMAAQAKVDPLGWGSATAKVLWHAAADPPAMIGAIARLALGAASVPATAASRTLTYPVSAPVELYRKDQRFADPAWEQNPWFYGLRVAYGLACRYLDDVLAAGAREDLNDRKSALFLHLICDALAPTNFLLTNPSALMRAFQSGGASVVEGARLAIEDVRERRGFPLKVDTSGFELGRNLAATPGEVIYRNELIELIQYAPQTERVHEVPILASPPWINKYYVMDLAPGRSFVEWAVQHERTVFMISYRNPDESMRDVTMDDYLEQGLISAIGVVSEITGAETVDVVGLCLGGAMAAMGAAHFAASTDTRIGSLTLLNTMLDYTHPGELETMVDPASLARLETRMNKKGFLPGEDMATAFDLLRAQDLVFRYIPTRWLAGERPAAFDILAWNGDSTRMPAAMHSTYLRSLYGANALARGEMDLAGRRLDLAKVPGPTYVVGAINDHIVPWTSSYAATKLLGGDVRYVLSSGGHIAGIVNPPSAKGWYEVSAEATPDPCSPTEWRDAADRRAGSWWEDWASWSNSHAGELITPPTIGSTHYPSIGSAPGHYVRG